MLAEKELVYMELKLYLLYLQAKGPMDFYDSNTGKLLYTAPVGRTMGEFLMESELMSKLFSALKHSRWNISIVSACV
jgi:hypothetical protein